METGRAPFKLLSFLVLLIILSWFSEFELYNVKIKNNSPPAVVSLGFFTVWNRRQRRVRLVIAKSTKHGLLALCLPETP
jgi:membrane-associated protease RseP (regulator of RpoE activity)